MNRRGGSHHHFLVVFAPSMGLVPAAAAAAAAAVAFRLSAAAFLALASCPGGLSGVAFANAAQVVALLVVCMLTSSVLSTNA